MLKFIDEELEAIKREGLYRGLRCIEDIPTSSKSGWRKFFTIH